MADLCERCFRPAKWLVTVGAMPGWPLEARRCGYHIEGREKRPITPEALAEKARLDDAYGRKFGTNYVPTQERSE